MGGGEGREERQDPRRREMKGLVRTEMKQGRGRERGRERGIISQVGAKGEERRRRKALMIGMEETGKRVRVVAGEGNETAGNKRHGTQR